MRRPEFTLVCQIDENLADNPTRDTCRQVYAVFSEQINSLWTNLFVSCLEAFKVSILH